MSIYLRGSLMRRTLGSGLLLLALTTTSLAPTMSTAAGAGTPDGRTPDRTTGRTFGHDTALARRADQALTHARDALAGRGGEPTMALVALRASYPYLSAEGKRQADRIFARPTDGADDVQGDGYDYDGVNGEPAVDAEPLCGDHVCIHYVTGSDDAPDPTDINANTVPDWVEGTLAEMEAVWTYEVGTRGYRAPASDITATNNGGDAKLDVYLANVSGAGLYGYCAPEGPVPGQPANKQFRGYGYCVLDDDYVGFPTPPKGSLKVTAAHEFFHMIQFNYDAFEDSWIMESTATWMEERYADAVNDNRFYLADSQMHRPSTPLDKFNGCCAQYGNWIFFERLSQAYGVDVVRTLWQRMDTLNGPDDYSVLAIRTVLAHKGTTFAKFYAKFAAGNLFPNKFYSEGFHYLATDGHPSFAAPISNGWKFTPKARFVTGKQTSLTHLTSRNFAFVPASTMKGTWYLTVKVDGPATAAGAGAVVLILKRNNSVAARPFSLSTDGVGRVRVPFGAGNIKAITLTLANGSTHYDKCYSQITEWSCDGGVPDGARTFKFSAVASR